jgi:hypothetical protein
VQQSAAAQTAGEVALQQIAPLAALAATVQPIVLATVVDLRALESIVQANVPERIVA